MLGLQGHSSNTGALQRRFHITKPEREQSSRKSPALFHPKRLFAGLQRQSGFHIHSDIRAQFHHRQTRLFRPCVDHRGADSLV